MPEFPATSGAFVRNNSTLRRRRRLHWLRYFAVGHAVWKRRAMAPPTAFPRFLRAWTRRIRQVIPLRQCFEECCQANVFRCAERKRGCRKLQRSLSHAADIGERPLDADAASSRLG